MAKKLGLFETRASSRRNHRRLKAQRRALLEQLEERNLLTFSPDALIDFHGPDLTGKDGPISDVDLSLLTVYHEYQDYLEAGVKADFEPSDPLIKVVNDSVIVDLVADVITTTDDTTAGTGNDTTWAGAESLVFDLEQLGAQITGTWGPKVSALLPITAIPQVAGLSAFHSASASAMMTSAGLVTSQGDPAMRSDVARAFNETDGSGITVGVLSDSYNSRRGAALDVANGELPTDVQVLQDSGWFGSDEGRAMMQLIADVAPGAGQAFNTAYFGQANFANGILRLANEANGDVIVDDILYYAEPMFQDGIIAQAVDQVVADGVAYFSSAGNQGRLAYEGEFRNSGLIDPFTGSPQHDFDPGPGVDVFQEITVPAGSGFLVSFQWDSPFFSVSPGSGGSPNDLDIVVYDSTGTIPLAGGINSNIGGDAVELFSFVNYSDLQDTFSISISKFAGPDAGYLKYVMFEFGGVDIVEFDTQSGSIYGHAFAAGAESIGAAFYAETPEFGVDPAIIESFSSAGGSPSGLVTPIFFDTNGNRLATPEIRDSKPGIVAPDGTNTTFFVPGVDVEPDGFPNFFGTSASAPHAAAVAALMLSSAGGPGSLTPTEIYTTLRDTALDMDDPETPGFDVGFDLATGFGFIDAEAAVGAVALPPLPVAPFPTPLDAVDPAGSLIYEGNLTRSIVSGEETDGFTILVDPGQSITVVVEGAASLQATAELFVLTRDDDDDDGDDYDDDDHDDDHDDHDDDDDDDDDNDDDDNDDDDDDGTTWTLVGTDTADNEGGYAVIQTVPTRGRLAGRGPGPETYLVRVSGANDTLGSYTTQIILNAAVEDESHDGPANDNLSAAQDLENSFVPLHGDDDDEDRRRRRPARGSVLGTTDFARGAFATGVEPNQPLPPDLAGYDQNVNDAGWNLDVDPKTKDAPPDWYSFDLKRGASATVAATALTDGDVHVELYDSAGNLVARGLPDPQFSLLTFVRPANVDGLISNFVAPSSGTYYTRVTGASGTDYSLVVTRSADFSIEDNNEFESAQVIASTAAAGRQWVLGAITPNIVAVAAFDTGWYQDAGYHDPTITNYLTGLLADYGEYRSFFAFDLSGLGGATEVISARFDVFSAFVTDTDPFENLIVSDVTTTVGEVVAGGSDRVDIFDDLGGGTLFGSRDVRSFEDNILLGVDLNDDALTALNAAVGQQFALGGALTTIDFASSLQYVFGFSSGDDTPQLELTLADTDYYRVSVEGKRRLIIETSTPANTSGEFANNLDLVVRLYDSAGNLVASNDNGASDGVNARLRYKVPKNAGGTYYITVSASDATNTPTRGEYILSVKGNTYQVTDDDLHVESQGSAAIASPGVFSRDSLAPFVEEAVAYWSEAGIDPANVAILPSAEFDVTDLPDSTHGTAYSTGRESLKTDAARYGWSLSPEVSQSRVDVVSTLTHEIGHLIGSDHDETDEYNVVTAALAPTLPLRLAAGTESNLSALLVTYTGSPLLGVPSETGGLSLGTGRQDAPNANHASFNALFSEAALLPEKDSNVGVDREEFWAAHRDHDEQDDWSVDEDLVGRLARWLVSVETPGP